MRPYLALIKDSFRAALATKVLYVLLAVITLLLLVIAPLHIVEVLDWRVVFDRNVPNPDQLAIRLVERGEDSKYPAINYVWKSLDESVKDDVITWANYLEDPETMPDANKRLMHTLRVGPALQRNLNKLIKDPDFYKPEIWEDRRLVSEARELIDMDVKTLTQERSRRLNRLLLANAIGGGLVKRGSGSVMDVRYAIWKWESLTFNMSYGLYAQTVTSTITLFFDKFVLSIGLFIAILVTANIIPETFLPGSLNLLLSKPISRWLLLLAKFVGGCILISLCAVYLFFGLWVWLGFGMKIWEPGILWGIPMYIIVFAIYYSVSTLVGVWSRSPILSIIMTVIFWAFCFGVGTGHNWVQNRLAHSRVDKVIPVSDSVLSVGEVSTVYRLNQQSDAWDPALELKLLDAQKAVIAGAIGFEHPDASNDQGFSQLGPVADLESKYVICGMMDVSDPSTQNYQDLFIANTSDLKFKQQGKMPRGGVKIMATGKGLLVADNGGQYWMLKDPAKLLAQSKVEEASEEDAKADGAKKQEKKKSGGGIFSSFLKRGNDLFENVSPRNTTAIRNPGRIAYNVAQELLIVLNDNNELVKYSMNDEGKFERGQRQEVEELIASSELKVNLASAGKTTVIALGNGQVLTFDTDSLQHQKTYRPNTKARYKMVDASPDGQSFVFLGRDQRCHLLDTGDSENIKLLNVRGQGSISAIKFRSDNKLWVAYEDMDALLYEISTGSTAESVAVGKGLLRTFYDYCLQPFYTICPKPGEFYRTVAHLADLTSGADDDKESEEAVSELSLNLPKNPSEASPWQPLTSGLVFMFFALGLACLIFQMRDF